jgi:hypothetical protein
LVEIFKNYHKEQDVCSMLLQVNEKASCEHAKKGYQQPCQLVFTTTKIVKFHPTSGYGCLFNIIINFNHIKMLSPNAQTTKREVNFAITC